MTTATLERYASKRFHVLREIASERQYDMYAEALFALEAKDHLTSDESVYAKLLHILIEEYDAKHNPVRDASPVEVLRALMEGNNLSQQDLVEFFGSASIVSEVLNGKRDFAKSHIEKLSRRFGLSPAVFFAK
jgi:HTH-type transcriptional regulator / antitoxin HigA